MNPQNEINIQPIVRQFREFLDLDSGMGEHADAIRDMLEKEKTRFVVNIDQIRKKDPELATKLILEPADYLAAFDKALQEVCATFREGLPEQYTNDLRIGIDGSFGQRRVSPRGLVAELVNNMVAVEGIVTRCSNVRAKLVKSVHYCPQTNQLQDKYYHDANGGGMSAEAAFSTSSIPQKDGNNNDLEMEIGRSWFRDSQRLTLQELPERAPPGQLPRSVDIFVDGDLVDSCKPGDRVRAIGIYAPIGGTGVATASAIFKCVIQGNYVTHLSSDAPGKLNLTEKDISNIKEIAKQDNAFEILSASVAPSVWGLGVIKRAILLLLLGGTEKNLASGTHLRGDINILMVGDPSTAKSQMLRFVLRTAPLAISTTGRGSSGVGLTAAVTRDQDTGDRHLEAGAMVLADRGVVCIDEFDKMSDEDRVAIHEVMEQQTVTIAKAGIHASLNARCSVLAAANPVYGSYDKDKKPHENIALPDSLLSRFDLLFIVLDSLSPDRDRQIADHVLRSHQYRNPNDTLLDMTQGDDDYIQTAVNASVDLYEENDTTSPVYDNSYRSLYGNAGVRKKILTIEFLKKYIHYAKARITPKLSVEASDFIAQRYTELRRDKKNEKDKRLTLPITARLLETLIRLATAHAKCRLSKTVEERDAAMAFQLITYALYNVTEAESKKNKRKRNKQQTETDKHQDDADQGPDGNNGGDDGEDDDGDDGEDDDGDEMEGTRRTLRSTRQRTRPGSAKDNQNGATQDDDNDNNFDDNDVNENDDETYWPRGQALLAKIKKGTSLGRNTRSNKKAAQQEDQEEAKANDDKTSKIISGSAEEEDQEGTKADDKTNKNTSGSKKKDLSLSDLKLEVGNAVVALTIRAEHFDLEDIYKKFDQFSREDVSRVLKFLEEDEKLFIISDGHAYLT